MTAIVPTVNHTAALVWAAVLTATVFLAVSVIRRYSAARTAGDTVFAALAFAVHFRRNGKIVDSTGLVAGADNRFSTSKFNALLWTVVLVFFLLAMAFVITDASSYRIAIGDVSNLYLVLLGGPFAAAVLAKGIVTTALADGTIQKSRADAPRVADLFSDDDGNTDLVDTQYIVFNVVVAAIVLAQFLHDPTAGAPPIPAFLAILTGASAATYVANKGVTTKANPPTIDRIVPAVARAGSSASVLGTNFLAQGEGDAPQVFVGGFPAVVVQDPRPTADRVDFVIPPGTAPGAVSVVVRSPGGAEGSVPDKLTVTVDEVTVTNVNSTFRPGDPITLTGTGFFSPADLTAAQQPLAGRSPATIVLTSTPPAPNGPAVSVACDPVGRPAPTDRQITATIPAGITPGRYLVQVERDGQRYPAGSPVVVT